MQNKLTYLLLLPLLLAAQTLLGQPIGLDPTFATNGLYTFTDGTTGEYFLDVAVQPSDGKPVVVGYTDYDPDEASNYRLVVMRFNLNGTPDATFGNNGKVYIDFPKSSDQPSAVTVQADGKILIAGDSDVPWSAVPTSTLPEGVVYRLHSNGSLDTGFGNGGRAYIDSEVSTYRNLTVQPDGFIVASGYGFAANSKFAYTLARFHPNGQPDSNFGPDGKGRVIFRSSTSTYEEDDGAGFGLALQADGKILTCGYDEKQTGAVARLNPDGSLDQGIGFGGFQYWDFTRDVFLQSMTVQADGKIVLVGYYDYSSTLDKAILIRLLPNGNPDNTLPSGYYFEWYGNDNGRAYDLEIQSDGKYVLGGGTDLIRLHTDGKPDATFSGDGYFDVPLSNIDIQNLELSGNKIYIAGYQFNGSDYNGFLARVSNNSSTAAHEIEGAGTVSLAPNPARELLRITFQQPESASGEVLLEAFDLAGRVVHSSVEQVSGEVQIPVSDWPNGMYYLSITATGSGARRTAPFVVQH